MTRPAVYRSSYFKAVIKFIKISFLILLFYLLQTVVMPHLKLWGIMPNLLMVCVAILTVSYGKKYAFISGAVFGILIEVMSPSLRIFNLLIYPALSLLCAQIFADMSEIKRELLRIKIAQRQADRRIAVEGLQQRKKLHLSFRRKTADDTEAHLRIVLNALTLTLMYETVMLVYFVLDGVQINFNHILRLLQTLFYTGISCIVIFPARAFLGMYRFNWRTANKDKGIGDSITTSERKLQELSLAPDFPNVAAAAAAIPLEVKESEHEDEDEDEHPKEDDLLSNEEHEPAAVSKETEK